MKQTVLEWLPVLAGMDLFSDLSPSELELFAGEMKLISLSQGQFLIRQDDPGDSLYVILEGQFLVTRKNDRGEEVHLNRVGPGACVGEIALVTGERRSASVRAECDSIAARLGRDAVEHARRTAPQVAARLARIIVERLQRAELQSLLFFGDQFKSMSQAVLQDLEAEMELKLCPSGACLMREGDDCDGSYVVVSGRLRVTHQYAGGEPRVATELGRGQTVGEIGILTGGKRTASVYAIRDTLVAKLSVESFKRLLRRHPEELVRHFAGNVINRLWTQTLGKSRDKNSVVTIALIPAGDSGPLTDFSRRLAAALSGHGPTLLLNSDLLGEYLSSKDIAQTPLDDPDNLSITRWLNHQESAFRHILYQTDAGLSEWTRRCLRQADRVVLVGDAASSPGKGEIEETLLTDPRYRPLPQSLVLLHREKDLAYGRTETWLRERPVRYHYHVCPSDPHDMARVGRLLSGKGVGLVLSGGGARGFAHIGAIRALGEAGIPIDKVGGSSMGSIVAGMTALRWDYRTMIEQACAFNYRMDYTFPAVALTAGKTITRQLKKGFGEQKIEDLWINFFCVSTDLNSSRQGVHDQGLLWKYVRASMSVPGLFPPVIEGNSFLVDGAVFNNMPVDVMRSQADIGPLIAFDVGAPVGLETETRIEGSFSGWQVLTRKLTPAARSLALPSLTKTLMASWLIKSDEAKETMRNLADFYLQFPVQEFGLLDFNRVKEIAERGYAYTSEKLTEWDRDSAGLPRPHGKDE
ncbi:MAG: cyclic nucleotide-binding domain-containing protein [Gammaproteobacteria bacterium]